MAEKRPNPEVLLKELNSEEEHKNKGKLKIFFGYAAGVGKTYNMLEEAHNLIESGIDVVIGYVEPHQRPETAALIDGLPQIPPVPIAYKSAVFYEFDIDSALKRKPAVILVDELAHTNAKGCRNIKRYQDIEELLRMGIDVYTTVNVQHIEGLHDVVESITGIAVRERVPDSIFDSADKVELIDIEPEDLVKRLSEGKIYKDVQAKRALENFFTKENLIALREIALRRTADRVSISVERNKSIAQNTDYHTGEHIMMCLSSSPSNAKVIRTAAKLAEAFHGIFTALFVETPDFAEMSEENKSRLRDNLRLAEQSGAKIATVYGDDVPYQVAEYAKASGVSKIVLGRSVRRAIFGINVPTFVDKLTAYAPNLEIYVIPNANKTEKKFAAPQKRKFKIKFPVFSWSDTLYLIICLSFATLIGFLFYHIGFAEVNIIMVYILASIFTAMITHGRIYGVAASVCSVLMFNYFFTEPRYTFNAYDKGYPVIFVVMFIASLIVSTLIKQVKEHARQSSLRANRTEVLLETSQKLQQAKSKDDILLEAVSQIKKLLNREVFLYPVTGNTLGDVLIAPGGIDQNKRERDYDTAKNINQYLTADEYAVAQWVLVNNKHAGATTDTLSGAKCLYMSIRSGEKVFAVVGIAMNGEKKLDSFEKSLLIAILAESALALEKENAREMKNEMTLRANTEQLRANLLRAISHDLRTPLTSIAGGSSFLLEMVDSADDLNNLDKDALRSMLSDISNDAQWLSSLVENLLNITRIEDGRLNVNKNPELADEVISAAVSKVIKRSGGRTIDIQKSDALIFVYMDAQLIIQVIVNLLDNAFKHTKENSSIEINYYTENKKFELSVSDNGGGLPSGSIDKIFDLFFTAASQNGSDKQRGMGLGLNICKSIVEAHGGTITAENNKKGGATFKITLPMDG